MRKVFAAGRYVRWGSGGSGLVLEISSFVGPCEHARADRRVQVGAQKTRVSDPYSFFKDPDPVDPDGGQYGSGSGSRALMTKN